MRCPFTIDVAAYVTEARLRVAQTLGLTPKRVSVALLWTSSVNERLRVTEFGSARRLAGVANREMEEAFIAFVAITATGTNTLVDDCRMRALLDPGVVADLLSIEEVSLDASVKVGGQQDEEKLKLEVKGPLHHIWLSDETLELCSVDVPGEPIGMQPEWLRTHGGFEFAGLFID